MPNEFIHGLVSPRPEFNKLRRRSSNKVFKILIPRLSRDTCDLERSCLKSENIGIPVELRMPNSLVFHFPPFLLFLEPIKIDPATILIVSSSLHSKRFKV